MSVAGIRRFHWQFGNAMHHGGLRDGAKLHQVCFAVCALAHNTPCVALRPDPGRPEAGEMNEILPEYAEVAGKHPFMCANAR
jgi:hypothetical protein